LRIWFDQNLKNESLRCIKSLDAHSFKVTSLINLLDGYFSSGSKDYKIKIWNKDFKLIKVLRNYSTINCLLLLPNGNLIAGINKSFKMWEYKNSYKDVKLLHKINDYENVSFASFNDHFLIGTERLILICDISDSYECEDYEFVNALYCHTDKISSIVTLKDNNFISSSWDYTIRLWKPK
jgi:WD40 repeat protein